jgi:hypothetical protein
MVALAFAPIAASLRRKGQVYNYSKKKLDDVVGILTRLYSTEMDFEGRDYCGHTCITALAFFATHIEWHGYLDLLAALLKAGLIVNSRTSENRSAFHMALYGCITTKSTEEWTRKVDDITVSRLSILRLGYFDKLRTGQSNSYSTQVWLRYLCRRCIRQNANTASKLPVRINLVGHGPTMV